MGACLHKNAEFDTQWELEMLGYEDTDTSGIEKRRTWEDTHLERTYTELPRFLAEKSRLRKLRRKEDKEHAKRKERRSTLIAKVEKRKSTLLSNSDFNRDCNDMKGEKKLQDNKSVGFVKSKPDNSSRHASTNVKLTPENSDISALVTTVQLTPEISEISRPVLTIISEDNDEEEEVQDAPQRLIDIDSIKMI